jgi:hypothetical protein
MNCLDCNKKISRVSKRCFLCYSKTRIGGSLSTEHRLAISKAQKGRKHLSQQGFQIGHKLIGNNPTSSGKNWKLSEDTKNKQSLSKTGSNNPCFGKEMLPQTKKALIKANTGNKYCLGKNRGCEHYRWVEDRGLLKMRQEERALPEAIEWKKKVLKRDNFKCKINNKDCSGRLEIHHILCFKDHPELRTDVNNGIVLCQFHHPRGRSNELKMVESFKSLIIK